MESEFNNVNTILQIGETWKGEAELCSGYVVILVYIQSSKRCTLKVSQSDNKSNYNFNETIEYLPVIGGSRFQIYRAGLYCYVEVINDSGEIIPDLLVRTHFLDIGRDSSIHSPTVVTGIVDIANFPTVQDVNITEPITVTGINNNFEFYPTIANNTSTIYADGTQGTNVAGGWAYSNLATGKINWYCYASAGLESDYKVSELNSMYTVVNNKSTLGLTLAQNPWVMIYTRPDSGTNGASWYKSKLFFGSNAFTDVLGIKLLYTGNDPVNIHPEITGNNRIQLLFVEALSTKALALAQNEHIMFGTLQTTNNTSQIGAFNFIMEEFGADWVKTPSILPIEFNKVKIDGSVSVSNFPANQAVTETNSGSIKTAVEAINGKITACNTGSVTITSQPHLSYLTDNVAVSTMPAITGTVSVSSQPHLSYITDNVAVVTMPAITGTVSVSSQPHLSYLTDNVAVATQPALAFSTDKVDVSGSSVSISSGAITETNSGSIKTAVEAINGKITACNTGSVTISSQSKTTSSITTWENPSSVISFDSNGATPQNIKASSGSLISMSVFNNAGGNAIGYLAIYDSLAENVTVGITIPKFVLALNHNVSIEIPCHNLQFSNAISYYVATAYGGAIHLSGIYITAFYDN